MGVSAGGSGRIRGLGATIVALALLLMVAAPDVGAADRIYWLNFGDGSEPASIGVASADGREGESVDLGGAQILRPEGMAYDPVVNRLYVANEMPGEAAGRITWVGLQGGRSGVFTAPGAAFRRPAGVAIDPATRTIYWVNRATGSESIGWARLDGSAGGTLNTTGAKITGPYRLALDPVGGRVYWSNFEAGVASFQFANVNNTGGGELTLTPPPEGVYGLAADPTSGRLYILDSDPTPDALLFTGLNGGAVGSIPLGTANKDGFGLAVDPVLGKAYWGNFGTGTTITNAIGFTALSGATGGITPVTAPVNGPQDPVVIKSPSGTGAPQLTQSKAQLSCTQGTWGPDFPGSFVYQSPRGYAFQWTLNGVPLAGATAPTLTATSAGTYGCTVTATNQAGSASQSSSAAATVTAGKFKLTAKRKVAKAKPGKLASFKVQTVNQGDISTKAAKLCVKVPKKAKKALKPHKCKSLKAVASGGKVTATLKVKVKPAATPKAYHLKITLPGTKALEVTLKVLG